MEKYRIIQRHEWYSNSGLTWTKWYSSLCQICDKEDDLKVILKNYKDREKEIYKATKLHTEYKIEKFDYTPITFSELKNIPKELKSKRKTKKTEE